MIHIMFIIFDITLYSNTLQMIKNITYENYM